MPYKETYCAYVRFSNGNPDIIWPGLTRRQAQWRFHYIKRNWYSEFREFREYGWKREFQA